MGGLRITSRSSPVSPSLKEESSASSTQPPNLEDGVTQEMVDALQRSDQSRDFTRLQEGHNNELKEDDVVVDMLKRQTAENQQILNGL